MRNFPRLYGILDADFLAKRGLDLMTTAINLRDGGLRLVQYRDKYATADVILRNAERIAEVFAGSGAVLLLNDSPELTLRAGWDGVHVGQSDSTVAQARVVLGPDRIIGLSTHTEAQVMAAEQTDADYIAFGPIFATSSKADPEPVVGPDGLRRVRAITAKPLIAIGGISREHVPEVLAAGADSVAVIHALFGGEEPVTAQLRSLTALL